MLARSTLALLVLLTGCGRGPSPTPTPPGAGPGAKPNEERVYPLRGEVVKVDRASGQVAIHHEEVPGYMPAMTMPFDLSGQDVLLDLQVGDRVAGTLRVGAGRSALTEVTITEMALATPRALIDGEAAPADHRLKPGDLVPDFAVTTGDGVTLRLSDLRGKVVALTFIYTRCPLPDFCPLMDRKFADLARLLMARPERARGVRLLSISFDPEHDTPEVLARHARTLGAEGPLWTFAVASHDELARVGPLLGLSYGPSTSQIVHTLTTAVIDPDGRLFQLEPGNKWTPEGLFRRIATRLDADPGS
jgi:protein SCO1/2